MNMAIDHKRNAQRCALIVDVRPVGSNSIPDFKSLVLLSLMQTIRNHPTLRG